MKAKIFIALALLAALLATSALAGPSTTGDNGLGYQVGGTIGEAPDADGDGIPNGQDPDYVRPADGTGSQFGKGTGRSACTMVLENVIPGLGGYWQQMRALLGTALGYGPGDGTGTGDHPQDGTGYGPGPNGDGTCDGDGGGMWQAMHR